MKRRRPVGLSPVRIPLLLWPFVAIALLCFGLYLSCKAIAELVRAYQARKVTGSRPIEARERVAPAVKARPPRQPAHRGSKLHAPVVIDEGDVLYERWKAGETKAEGTPPTRTIDGKKTMGRVVNMDDLAGDQWEPFPDDDTPEHVGEWVAF